MNIGLARLVDIPQFLVWLFSNPKNSLDPKILDYPTLRVYSAANEKQVGFLPIHSGVILDSVALDPGSPAEQKLEAVAGMVNLICAEAFQSGIREVFYISSDERTDESAVRQLGFEKVICYRKKL